jgi:putative hydrolase of the HAD superfamily
VEPDVIAPRLAQGIRAAGGLALSKQALAEIPALEREHWRGIVRTTLGNAAADGPCFDALFDAFGSGKSWRVFEGAREALARLRGAGVRIAVVSNMDFRLRGLLAELALESSIDHVLCPSSCGFAKPDPRIFVAALDALRVAPLDALYIGDRERDCVAAARAAGLATRRFDPRGDPRDPDVLVSWKTLAA